MKGVWFSLVALALCVAGVVSVAPSIAQAAGLTSAQVLAEIAGHHALDTQPAQLGQGGPLSALRGHYTESMVHASNHSRGCAISSCAATSSSS
jgi:hypothetical protein